jgi:hypothetical protein
MIWEQYVPYSDDRNMGTLVSVFLNKEKTLIKRVFEPSGITTSGIPNTKTKEYVSTKWETESYYLTKFRLMPWVPGLVSIDYKTKSIIQKYYGPDLLIAGFEDIPDIEDQVVEIYRYFNKIGVYKLNGALSNMTKRDGKVIMFDFKYMRPRTPELKDYALIEIDQWLSKISPTISKRLKELV